MVLALACQESVELPAQPPEATIHLVSVPALAPSWTVAYGEEFWRRATADIETGAAAPPGVNLGDVINRVTHAIGHEGNQLPNLVTRTYSATFDGHGLVFASNGGELRLRTRRVTVGELDVYRGDRRTSWSVLGNTAQALLAPALVEHHETRSEGVEVSWILRERPLDGADFSVEVEVAGLGLAAANDTGLHFAGADGVSSVRIGRAELVDARGERWPVAAAVDGDVISWRVDGAILADASFPVALDPVVGPEIGVDQEVIVSENRLQPAIAFNGSYYLVVWQHYLPDLTLDIRGTRVSPDGWVLDPRGIGIATASGHQAAPQVASNGSDFLVVWEQDASGTDIHGAHVSGLGVVRDPGTFAIATSPGWQQDVAVASDGTDYLVVWTHTPLGGNSEIYGKRVDAAGAVLDGGDGIAVSTGTGNQREPSVASNGDAYFVAWADSRNVGPGDIYGARVDATGAVLDPAGLAITTAVNAQESVSVASDGNAYLIVWDDQRNDANSTDTVIARDVYASRVGAAGDVLDPDGIPIALGTGNAGLASVASDGSEYFVAWQNAGDFRTGTPGAIYGARVTGGGAVDAESVLLSGEGANPQAVAVASDGSGYLVAWQDQRHGNMVGRDVHGVIVAGGAIQPAGDFSISNEAAQQVAAAISSNGSGYLLVWHDERNGRVEVFGTRLDSQGEVLDLGGLGIAVGAGSKTNPSVASNGTDYFVAWQDLRAGSYDIYGTRVTAAGAVLDGTGLDIATASNEQRFPSVASDGTDYLVAWDDARSLPRDIYGGRVTAAGAVLDGSGFELSLGDAASDRSQLSPAVASNGNGYLVVWDHRDNASEGDIHGTRVSAAGEVMDPAGVRIADVAETSEQEPAIASNGTEYVVVWTDSSNNALDVHAARVTASGSVLDSTPIVISASSGHQERPVVGSNGVDYFVSWQVHRGPDFATDVFGARLTAAGSVLDTDGIAIAATGEGLNEHLPVVAFNASLGEYLVVYNVSRVLDLATATPTIRFRLFARRISGDCGDSVVAPAEGCDDGGTAGGDGCSSACTVEPGHTCTGSPSECTDLDECAAGTNDCDVNATCSNTVGAYTCTCNDGFTGGGDSCQDVDECASGIDDCDDNAACSNSVGGFTCACKDGYEGDGVTCADVDECAAGTYDCDANAECTNTPGGFTCACTSGFVGDGRACSDVDECAGSTDDCDENAACTNTPGGFTCECLPRYGGDGRTCTPLDTDGDGLDDVDDACANDHPGDRDLDHDGCEDDLAALAALLDGQVAALEASLLGRPLFERLLVRSAMVLSSIAAADLGAGRVARAVDGLLAATLVLDVASGTDDGKLSSEVMRVLAAQAIVRAEADPSAKQQHLERAQRAYAAGLGHSASGRYTGAAAKYREAWQSAGRAVD